MLNNVIVLGLFIWSVSSRTQVGRVIMFLPLKQRKPSSPFSYPFPPSFCFYSLPFFFLLWTLSPDKGKDKKLNKIPWFIYHSPFFYSLSHFLLRKFANRLPKDLRWHLQSTFLRKIQLYFYSKLHKYKLTFFLNIRLWFAYNLVATFYFSQYCKYIFSLIKKTNFVAFSRKVGCKRDYNYYFCVLALSLFISFWISQIHLYS